MTDIKRKKRYGRKKHIEHFRNFNMLIAESS